MLSQPAKRAIAASFKKERGWPKKTGARGGGQGKESRQQTLTPPPPRKRQQTTPLCHVPALCKDSTTVFFQRRAFYFSKLKRFCPPVCLSIDSIQLTKISELSRRTFFLLFIHLHFFIVVVVVATVVFTSFGFATLPLQPASLAGSIIVYICTIVLWRIEVLAARTCMSYKETITITIHGLRESELLTSQQMDFTKYLTHQLHKPVWISLSSRVFMSFTARSIESILFYEAAASRGGAAEPFFNQCVLVQ